MQDKLIKKYNEKGITLIALVITSVSVMVGDNSVIDQAKNSKEEMEIAQWEEKINQAIIEAEGGNRDVILDDIIGELIDKGVIEDPDDVDRYTGTVTTKEPEHIIEGLLDDYVDAPPSLAENVKFTVIPNTPTNKPVVLKIETGIEGFTLQYSLDDGENWEDYDEAKGITLEHNDVVFARLWSGLKESEYATANVENIDRLPPNSFSVTVSEVGINEITVTGGTVDAEKTDEDACSGINGYYFSNDGGVTWEPSVPQKDPNYTFEGLEPDTNYDIVIKAEDNAGNEVETVKKPQKTEPDKLDPPTMTFKSKTTSSITVDAVVQDKAGRDITYTLYVSTNKNGPYTAKASTTKVAGTKVTLTASELSMYTNYYYYVGIQSGKVTAETTSKGNVRTYCSGRTNVCTPKHCSGGYTSSGTRSCSTCGGDGKRSCTGSFDYLYYGGVDAPGGKCGGCGAGSGKYGGYNWSCSTCGASGGYYWCSKCGYNTGSKESHRTISCSTCGGDGRVSYTSRYDCTHGYYSSHYYCQHSNNRSSATHYYCAHSQAGVQHD